jgi:hypothetical protein
MILPMYYVDQMAQSSVRINPRKLNPDYCSFLVNNVPFGHSYIRQCRKRKSEQVGDHVYCRQHAIIVRRLLHLDSPEESLFPLCIGG